MFRQTTHYYWVNWDHMDPETLVSTYGSSSEQKVRAGFRLLTKALVMMVLDLSVIPAFVLVVEDEMLLRMRAVDMVEDAGFTPLEAVDADEALAILDSRSDIALLLTVIQMPGTMDGLMLAHAVDTRWPRIKIILVSGQLKPASIDIPADSRFFGKPLVAREMIAEMQSMIGQPRQKRQ